MPVQTTPQSCMAAFVGALIARDIAAALALLTDDVVFFYSNGTVLRGKENFAATMTTNWKLVSDYKYTTLDPAWLAQSDIAAAVIYGFSWTGVAGGNVVGGSGRGTRIFRREAPSWRRRRSGWRIAHEHLSQGGRTPNA
jgi:ketosteroid isomerase-like protein